jgi:hypothetical protein
MTVITLLYTADRVVQRFMTENEVWSESYMSETLICSL